MQLLPCSSEELPVSQGKLFSLGSIIFPPPLHEGLLMLGSLN